MNINSLIFWVATVIVAWLGIRHLITIIIGVSQTGQLKAGQRLCHATSLLLLWGSCVAAIYYRIWWFLLVGALSESILRNIVIKSGEIVSEEESVGQKSPSFLKRLKAIIEIVDDLRFCLYLRLRRQYQLELREETASVLAVQVTNYLMGDDFLKVYSDLSSKVKNMVDGIRDLIEPKADEAMTKSKTIRELIFRHIITTNLIHHCLSDKAWFDKPEIHNREKLIQKYDGNQFPQIEDVEDFDKYMAFALDFIRTTETKS